jgi:hypothetical protein
MHLKEALTKEAVRLQATIANNNTMSVIQAARTRWENKNRAYWEEVEAAAQELRSDKRKRPASVAEARGIDPLDLAEVLISRGG